MKKNHEFFMAVALEEAKKAGDKKEVPVGCVIVKEEKIIGRGHNKTIKRKSPLDHAEIVAIMDAKKHIEDWRFLGATIYITLEPCLMCAGAILNGQFDEVVYGASNLDSGVLGGVVNVFHMDLKKHIPKIKAGVLKEECEEILQTFFKDIREIN